MGKLTCLVWLAAICLAGFGVGHTIAQTCPCPPETCNGVDGIYPIGTQASHSCTYTENSCPAAGGCTAGWCRRDECNPCPGYTGGNTIYQCQNEQTCQMSGQQVSLCNGNCSQ